MKKQVRIIKKGQDEDNLKYWLSLSPQERLKNLEELRQEINANEDESGFQRVYNVIKRP